MDQLTALHPLTHHLIDPFTSLSPVGRSPRHDKQAGRTMRKQERWILDRSLSPHIDNRMGYGTTAGQEKDRFPLCFLRALRVLRGEMW